MQDARRENQNALKLGRYSAAAIARRVGSLFNLGVRRRAIALHSAGTAQNDTPLEEPSDLEKIVRGAVILTADGLAVPIITGRD